MKLIIEISEEVKKEIDAWKGKLVTDEFDLLHSIMIADDFDLVDSLKNDTPIHDNATNGDILKAMFHCLEKYEYEETYTHGIALAGNDNRVTWFAKDWWNSPYQKGNKE